MKNGLGPQALARIGDSLKAIDPDFNSVAFQAEAVNTLETLELKQRVNHIIKVLHYFLPIEFSKTVKILEKLPQYWVSGDSKDSFSVFAAWPLIDYVAEYGLEEPLLSLALLKKLTPLFSAEFAIRPFLLKYPELTFKILAKWVEDDDEHIRRLVSEGTRPRLPWGIQLKPLVKDPTPVWTLLDDLKNDPSLYVRRSVANHLNDISKDHPEEVLKHCSKWHLKASEELLWVIRHGTRTLIKNRHPKALLLQGVEPRALDVSFQVQEYLRFGDSLTLSIGIESKEPHESLLIVDYAIHFLKANGKLKPKVFKGKKLSLPAKESMRFSKKHPIKPITTRKYYAGLHQIEVFINGVSYGRKGFELYFE